MKEIISTTPDCEIVSTRTINAPIAMVYQAWTDPDHLKNWWGPKGFTNTFYEFDLRPGGRWRFTMHGPEKGNYENECEFIQIIPMEFIAWDRISNPKFQVVVLLKEPEQGVTHITFKMLFASARECDKIKGFVTDKNEENFDKLEEELKRMLL